MTYFRKLYALASARTFQLDYTLVNVSKHSNEINKTVVFSKTYYAHHKVINNLTGTGVAWLFNSVVAGDINIDGILIATHTKITGAIHLRGRYMELNNVSATNIEVMTNMNEKNRRR